MYTYKLLLSNLSICISYTINATFLLYDLMNDYDGFYAMGLAQTKNQPEHIICFKFTPVDCAFIFSASNSNCVSIIIMYVSFVCIVH